MAKNQVNLKKPNDATKRNDRTKDNNLKLRLTLLKTGAFMIVLGTILVFFKAYYEYTLYLKEEELELKKSQRENILLNLKTADQEIHRAYELERHIDNLTVLNAGPEFIISKRKDEILYARKALKVLDSTLTGNYNELTHNKWEKYTEYKDIDPNYKDLFQKVATKGNIINSESDILRNEILKKRNRSFFLTILIGVINSLGLIIGYLSNYLKDSQVHN